MHIFKYKKKGGINLKDEYSIVSMLPVRFREICHNMVNLKELEEIRLRVNSPIMFYDRNGEINEKGNELTVKDSDIKETIEYISGYSLYAYEDEIKEGFLTIRGGHRIGLAGKVVLEKGRIKNLTNISSINIRISHEINNIARPVASYIFENGIKSVLIISSPGIGKTTFLRDLIRTGSDDYRKKIAIVDERSEIASSYMGKPTNDIGKRTDVLDGCPKDMGILMALRALSPDIIAVDEIGGSRDLECVNKAFNCGVNIFATIHAGNIKELQEKEGFEQIIKNKSFKSYVVLKKTHGTRSVELYDEALCRVNI